MSSFTASDLEAADLLALARLDDGGARPAVTPPQAGDGQGRHAMRLAGTGQVTGPDPPPLARAWDQAHSAARTMPGPASRPGPARAPAPPVSGREGDGRMTAHDGAGRRASLMPPLPAVLPRFPPGQPSPRLSAGSGPGRRGAADDGDGGHARGTHPLRSPARCSTGRRGRCAPCSLCCPSDRRPVTGPGTDSARGLSVSSRSEGAHTIAALSGELDIASAPALREQLLGLLRPAASRLVIDLSAVSYADASGLAVLVGTGRRAGLLGGFLHLAAPAPAVAEVLRITGLHLRLDMFPTVQAAITSPARGQLRPDGKADAGTGIGAAGPVHTGPARGHTGRARRAAGAAELRPAIAAVLMHADAWRDADPCRRFTPALDALAGAYAGTSQAAVTRAAHSLLSVLTRQPLTYSPAVAATASRLRRLLNPIAGPPSPEANPRTRHRPERPGPIGRRHAAMTGGEPSLPGFRL